MDRILLKLCIFILTSISFSSLAAERPNILLILGDDMGYSDLHCMGGQANTPNLDALARTGVLFTQFYNGARCCPTRASLLTGLYAHQAGVGHMIRPVNYPGYRGDLSHQAVTIAEVLKASGYRTYMCGKWHVAKSHHQRTGIENWPVQRGFDKFYGTIRGFGSYYDPETLCRQNKFITPENDPEYKPEHFYYTEALTDNAIKFLHDDASKHGPFFMYLAYSAAHWPLHAPEKDIAKYKGRFDAGYDALRKERYQNLKKLGLIDPNWQLTPTIGNWTTQKNKEWEARCMEVYSAMIDNMDQGIGRIVDELKKEGRFENTLILFLQDNGACAEPGFHAPLKGQPPADLKPMGPNELQHHPTPPMQTRDGRWVKSGPEVMPGGPDSYIAYGEKWANVSNTPFREYKHWVHEGGISTPMIAHWPAGIPRSRDGKIDIEPAHIIDLMATCVELSGATYPKEFHGETIKPLEGISLKPAFDGKPLNRKSPLCWEHESNRAIRDGKWKLVAIADQPWELYNMEADRTEMHDLAAKNPKKVAELEKAWDAWAKRADVYPLGAWKPVYHTPGK